MKKNKSKSRKKSANKELRKTLADKLTVAFNEVLAQYGGAKKTDKILEKFAKQLAKKINVSVKHEAKTEIANDEKLVKADKAKKVVKEPIKKTKVAEKATVEKK